MKSSLVIVMRQDSQAVIVVKIVKLTKIGHPTPASFV